MKLVWLLTHSSPIHRVQLLLIKYVNVLLLRMPK